MNNKKKSFLYTFEEVLRIYHTSAQNVLTNAGLDVTFDQWQLLNVINNNPGYSQREASDAILKDTASVTRIADLLMKKGYVIREAGVKDKRSKRIVLTEEGKQLKETAEELIDEFTKNVFAGIDPKRLKKLQKLMAMMKSNMKKS